MTPSIELEERNVGIPGHSLEMLSLRNSRPGVSKPNPHPDFLPDQGKIVVRGSLGAVLLQVTSWSVVKFWERIWGLELSKDQLGQVENAVGTRSTASDENSVAVSRPVVNCGKKWTGVVRKELLETDRGRLGAVVVPVVDDLLVPNAASDTQIVDPLTKQFFFTNSKIFSTSCLFENLFWFL